MQQACSPCLFSVRGRKCNTSPQCQFSRASSPSRRVPWILFLACKELALKMRWHALASSTASKTSPLSDPEKILQDSMFEEEPLPNWAVLHWMAGKPWIQSLPVQCPQKHFSEWTSLFKNKHLGKTMMQKKSTPGTKVDVQLVLVFFWYLWWQKPWASSKHLNMHCIIAIENRC